MKTSSPFAIFTAILVSLFTSSCEEVIEYSPYQNIVPKKWKNQNISNYNALLPAANEVFEPFKVALIADTHTYYDEFEKQVKFINSFTDIDFVIHLGDVTLSANSREFEWYSDIMNKLNVPVITIIGNHDCLGNGYSIYTDMFGESNFYFEYRDVKFVIFDDIIWEKHIADPDFTWFNNALKNDGSYKHVIPFAHIAPWDDQFSMGNELYYNYILEENHISLSVHGHDHHYKWKQPYGEVNYMTVPSPDKQELIILDIHAEAVQVERLNY
ncbi:metallophosphoesterase [Carboxylicivirga mesophila]|uniref:Metallophosphoesterase n=1 Tax=Carboxylicivirga mesophila TaxID=1166478 RepID=A0ABS5KBZ3_9BACT|nr:metallophosphoesterase [Carboxylicivirga mesophila]MBS2212347.1 metallophosphoesterase [Carboxylicivirga mesophila]